MTGPNFGSRDTPYLKKPAIALAWDRPTSGNSAGQTRFVLERQFGYPVTAVRTQQLTGAELSQFQVLILPESGGGEGGYADVLGPAGINRLKQWVSDGGTIIGIGTAVQFLADPRMGLLPIQQENRVPETRPGLREPALALLVAAVVDEGALRHLRRPPKLRPRAPQARRMRRIRISIKRSSPIRNSPLVYAGLWCAATWIKSNGSRRAYRKPSMPWFLAHLFLRPSKSIAV